MTIQIQFHLAFYLAREYRLHRFARYRKEHIQIADLKSRLQEKGQEVIKLTDAFPPSHSARFWRRKCAGTFQELFPPWKKDSPNLRPKLSKAEVVATIISTPVDEKLQRELTGAIEHIHHMLCDWNTFFLAAFAPTQALKKQYNDYVELMQTQL